MTGAGIGQVKVPVLTTNSSGLLCSHFHLVTRAAPVLAVSGSTVIPMVSAMALRRASSSERRWSRSCAEQPLSSLLYSTYTAHNSHVQNMRTSPAQAGLRLVFLNQCWPRQLGQQLFYHQDSLCHSHCILILTRSFYFAVMRLIPTSCFRNSSRDDISLWLLETE